MKPYPSVESAEIYKLYVVSELKHRAKQYSSTPKNERSRFYQSCKSWTLNEIYNGILESNLSPAECVENYIRTFDKFSCDKSKSSFCFSIAKEIALWAEDEILSMSV